MFHDMTAAGRCLPFNRRAARMLAALSPLIMDMSNEYR
jgi:hypothetical protein